MARKTTTTPTSPPKKPASKTVTVDARRAVTPMEVRRLLRPLELADGDTLGVVVLGRGPGSTRFERAVALVARYAEIAGASVVASSEGETEETEPAPEPVIETAAEPEPDPVEDPAEEPAEEPVEE